MKIKKEHNHSMSLYLLFCGLMFSGFSYVTDTQAEPKIMQKQDYPWEIINTGLKYQSAKTILLDTGFQPDSRNCRSRTSPSGTKDLCTFKGKWQGKWKGAITIYAQDSHIRNISFVMYYPLSAKAQISNYFYQTIRTAGKAAESCDYKNVETYYVCDYVEDAKTSMITGKSFYHHFTIRANPKSGKDTMVSYKINESRAYR